MLYKEYLKLDSFQIHRVGNKTNGDSIFFSKNKVSVNEGIKQILLAYFLLPFKSEEYYQFYHHSALTMNEVYTYVSNIFDNPNDLPQQSINLAKHLFNQSTHPQVKGGEFYVVYFRDSIIDGKTVDAVGLFKSENKETFLKVYSHGDDFEVESEQGININKLDKGCLIFNIENEAGYVVSVVDNTNKGAEAQYWIDNFLHVRQRQDKYFNTENTLSVYKDYVLKQLPEEYAVTKADQADLLNRSISFFKDKDNFKLEEFANQVLQYPEYIIGFNQFKNQYEQERNISIADDFAISDAALKQQARHFKSVIKLDKNFHIYIHGNKNLIERGEDSRGRFYKIYFERES